LSAGLGAALFDGLRSAGSRQVLVSGQRRLTGDDVLTRVSSAAARLAARGVAPGDTIACLYGHGPETVLARLTAFALGCRFISLLQAVPMSAAAYAMRESSASILLNPPSRRDDARTLLAEVPVRVHEELDCDADGLFAVADAPEAQPHLFQPDEIASVTFTTGTTNRPKAIGYSHRAEAAHLAAAQALYGPAPWRFLLSTRNYLPNQIALWTLATGGTAVLTDDIRPERLLELIHGERVTQIEMSTSTLYALADHLVTHPTGLDRLQVLIYGGEAAVPARSAQAAALLNGRLMQCYGATEAGLISVLSPDDHDSPDILASAGRAAPGVELRVCDPDGARLPPGAVGEVWVRSPQVMTGYVGDTARTRNKLMHDGWLRTGDHGRLTGGGYLFLLGRMDLDPSSPEKKGPPRGAADRWPQVSRPFG
jgi:fatty-acyl-CoA synthase